MTITSKAQAVLKAVTLISLAVVPVIATSSVQAQTVHPLIDDQASAEKLCVNESKNLLRRHEIDGEPAYFAKPLILDGKIKYGFVKGKYPVMFDPETGKYTKVRGNYDPVASFDNKIVAVLEGTNQHYQVLFFDAASILTDKPKMLDVPAGLDIHGAYQSIAPVKLASGGQGYRVLIDQVHQDQAGNLTTFPGYIDLERKGDQLIPQAKEIKPACPGKRLQVPFISKDGKLLAAINLETLTTQVFSIENGKCDLKQDIGYMTGKADFNYDGTKIVFHIADVPDTDQFGWLKAPNDGNVSNVFTHDLKTGRREKITRNVSSNSYYPVFLPDGTIMHIDKFVSGGTNKFAIGVSKQPERTTESATAAADICRCDLTKKPAAFAIGKLLTALCSDAEFQKKAVDEAAVILKTEGLSGPQCRTLVTKFWNDNNIEKIANITAWDKMKTIKRETFTGLKIKDLTAACPAGDK